MAVDPSGELSLVLSNVRTLIAATSAFQTWTDSDNLTEALTHVYYVYCAVADEIAARPYAVVDWTDDWLHGRIAHETHTTQATVRVAFVGEVPAAYTNDEADAMLWFANTIGSIVADLKTQARAYGVILGDIATEMRPVRADEKERVSEGDWMMCILQITIGVGGEA